MRTDPKPYRRSVSSRLLFDSEAIGQSLRSFGRGWAVEYWDGGDHSFRWFWSRRRANRFGAAHAGGER